MSKLPPAAVVGARLTVKNAHSLPFGGAISDYNKRTGSKRMSVHITCAGLSNVGSAPVRAGANICAGFLCSMWNTLNSTNRERHCTEWVNLERARRWGVYRR